MKGKELINVIEKEEYNKKEEQLKSEIKDKLETIKNTQELIDKNTEALNEYKKELEELKEKDINDVKLKSYYHGVCTSAITGINNYWC